MIYLPQNIKGQVLIEHLTTSENKLLHLNLLLSL